MQLRASSRCLATQRSLQQTTSQPSSEAQACLCRLRGMSAGLNGSNHRLSTQLLACRRYAIAVDAVNSRIIEYTIRNTDPYNALEIGALGLPLCFQVMAAGQSHGQLDHWPHSASPTGPLGRAHSGADGPADGLCRLPHGPAGGRLLHLDPASAASRLSELVPCSTALPQPRP